MAKKFVNKLPLIKVMITLNLYAYSLLYQCNTSYPILKNNECVSTYCSENQFKKEECIIDNPIIKEKWLNNIIIFENTTGYNSLSKSTYFPFKLMFKTTTSDNEQTIIYMLYEGLFTTTIIDKTEIIKKEEALMNVYSGDICIFSIGTDNSPIEILNFETKDLNYIEPNSFLNGDKRIIKSISFIHFIFSYPAYYYLMYGAVTILQDEPINYNLTLYYYRINPNSLDFLYSSDLDLIKSEYASCFVIIQNLGHTSCFYLSKENSYKIIIIENNSTFKNFTIKNEIIVQNLSDTNDENLYFLKAISIKQKTTGECLCLYMFYSGENNNIPTFLIKKIYNFSIKDLFPDLSVIYLNDNKYLFNNKINYNDLTYKNEKEIYFISTSLELDNIIISYIQIYSNSLGQNKTIVRYYILKIKEYHNFNIFNGLDTINLDQIISSNGLVLAIDFCKNDSCQNEDKVPHNSGLIFLSYINYTNINIDFIKYAYNNNKNYYIFNVKENIKIDNNIFGYKLGLVVIYENYYGDYTDVSYYNMINEEEILDFSYNGYEYNPYEDSIILKYNLFKQSSMIYITYPTIFGPDNVNQFNEFCDEISGNLNDINNDLFYEQKSKSFNIKYIINIDKDLSKNCTDPKCILCFDYNRNYCIVCEDDSYTIINDENYTYTNGKSKICKKEENLETFITEQLDDSISDSNFQKEEYASTIIANDISDTNTKDIITDINDISNTEMNDIKDSDNNYISSTEINELTEVNELSDSNSISKTNDTSGTNEISDSNDITNINHISETDTNEISDTIDITDINYISNINTNDIENTYTSYTNEIFDSKEITDTNSITNNNEISDTNIISETNDIENVNGISNINDMSDADNMTNAETNYITDMKDISDTIQISYTNHIQIEIAEISLEDLFNNKYADIAFSSEQIKTIYELLKNYIKINYSNDENIRLNTSNVKIQISTLESQKYSELSNIYLGECGKIINEKYCKSENDSLTMIKFDIKLPNDTSTFVQYEIYEPKEKIFLELKECTGKNVIINIPIILDSYIEFLYYTLSKSGYQLFDAKDPFYNDICAAYTTENGTDILLYDRRMDIYQLTVNIPLCQKDCIFKSYNLETKKMECDCPIQDKKINTELSSLEFNSNKMLKEFYKTLQNSNFRVLICYKLVYNIRVFKKNIGSIIMTILQILFLFLMVYSFSKNAEKIKSYIKLILMNKKSQNNKDKSNKNKKKQKKSDKKGKGKKKRNGNSKRTRKNSIFNKPIEANMINENEQKLNKYKEPPKKNRKKINSIEYKTNSIINKNSEIKPNSNSSLNELESRNPIFINKKKENEDSKNIINIKDININIFHGNEMLKKKSLFDHKKEIKKIKEVKDTKEIEEKNDKQLNELILNGVKLNDEEMNSLKYLKAVKLDKRTYCQYYFSLLKKKHLILFTFLPTNDYNIVLLKIALFIVSFSLFLNINAFFFDDKSMHKIYKNNGVFNIIYQIPQILYSSIISSIINILLKNLSLSEKDILKIKKEKDMDKAVEKSKSIEKCIKIKFIFFFIISLILMLFFWYFISCFCAVYNNTQIILFKDTLISFGLSMIYPFGINLFPGIFRIPALKAQKHDRKCMYIFSQYLALI